MTQYNIVNLKLSAAQQNKLKSATKNATDVTLRLSSNITDDDETNFPQSLFGTSRQRTSHCKPFANKS